MKIRFEPTGTHTHKDILKIRLDLLPEPIDKSYNTHYVNVPVIPEGSYYPGDLDEFGNPKDKAAFDLWVQSFPTIWRVTPCLSTFVNVPQNINKTTLAEWFNDVIKADEIATIDDIMVKTEPGLSAHLISPFLRKKMTLEKEVVPTFDEQMKDALNTELAGFLIDGAKKGHIMDILPGSFDIGMPAIDRANSTPINSFQSYYTVVNQDNPSDTDGTIDTVEVWLNNSGLDGSDVFFGSFAAAGNVLTCDDSEGVGAVTKGSKQTSLGLTIDVLTGEYIGICDKVYDTSSRYVEKDLTGFTGVWSITQEKIDPGDSGTYGLLTGDAASLYGTGNGGGGGGGAEGMTAAMGAKMIGHKMI